MNYTKTLLEIQQKLERAHGVVIAQQAIINVLAAKILTAGRQRWRVDLADLSLAARYEIGSMDLDDEAMRDAARDALASWAKDMDEAFASAERAGMLSSVEH